METKYYIGYSTDSDIRYKSSSGGIGTAFIKYLLSQPEYGTSMTFFFNKKKCAYEPKLIYSFEEYNNCGSVYQDIDNIGFIKDNIQNIRKGIIVTCMPCQVKAIRHILDEKHIPNFILSFCCSGQTTIEGTWCYYKLLGINKDIVSNLQYRGNGWPSGISVTLKDGSIIKKDNYTFPWTLVHQSKIYSPKRCLFCNYKTVPYSDINLADPWLEEFEESDKIGHTLYIINTVEGGRVHNDMLMCGLLAMKEVDEYIYNLSQKGTIELKKKNKEKLRYNNLLHKVSSNDTLRRIITSSSITIKIYIFLISKLARIL